jgi:hypothetical protein
MRVVSLSDRPQDVSVVLRTYQFDLLPDQINGSRPIAFRLRYSHQQTASNWIDCKAVRDGPRPTTATAK